MNNKKDNNCYFYFTHSSILPHFMEGLLGNKISKDRLKAGAIFAVDYEKKEIVKHDGFK